MHASEDSFDALLNQVRSGSEAALLQLVQKYEHEVRLAARMLLGSKLRRHVDSIDLVQSVHFTLVEGLQQGKFQITTPDKLVSLAVTIVRRKIINHWRRQERHERWQSAESPTNPSDTAAWDDLQVGPAEVAEQKDAVEFILHQLQGTDRKLIELRLEGLTTAEIAERLGIDSHLLRVRLGRLRERLRVRGLLNDWI
jgi:RNA polymerase sigma-70 factor (ECF subfamily)